MVPQIGTIDNDTPLPCLSHESFSYPSDLPSNDNIAMHKSDNPVKEKTNRLYSTFKATTQK